MVNWPPVVVAVLTYRRNEPLAKLLPILLDHIAHSGAAGRVLVVDNDPDAGARDVARSYPSVQFVHESVPGIAAGRNRALSEAAHDEWLVFIDDDETPVDGWLHHLLETKAVTGADAVVGWVDSVVDATLDPWVRSGGFFVRPRYATGTEMPMAATNNLLLDVASVRRFGLRFDVEFGLSGGSDTLFTRQLVRAGGRIVWCDDAVVLDPVSAARASRRWVLMRRFRFGNTWARSCLALENSTAQRAAVRGRLVGAGLARIAAGSLHWVLGGLTGSMRRRAVGLGTAARGLGMVAGGAGYVYVEYRRRG